MKALFERIRQPLCTHRWEVIGHLIDSHEGYLVVIRCPQCGARQQVPPEATPAAETLWEVDRRFEV